MKSEDSGSCALLEHGRGGAHPTPEPFRPLAIDLYCGLGGWTEALLAEGWRVIGFDIERQNYGTGTYPGQLVLQDVRTLNGAQFRDVDLIVASPPCQFFSRMAMPFKCPWKQEEFERRRNLAHELFWACFRIQSEACAAAALDGCLKCGIFHPATTLDGCDFEPRRIPMIVENVCGAQKWIGEARSALALRKFLSVGRRSRCFPLGDLTVNRYEQERVCCFTESHSFVQLKRVHLP